MKALFVLNDPPYGTGRVLLCGTCMDARGMTAEDVMDGARRSTMDDLAAATVAVDRVLVF